MNDSILWNYLKRKCAPLNDNNYTARLIFDRVTRPKKKKKFTLDSFYPGQPKD